jgi:CelD/BcsL family acetyltransferase involved in cellulose biosynthesis
MGGSVFLYYSGFDPAWSKYSVVMVATGEVIKRAIGGGLQRVEFLRGTDPFKTRWGTTQRVSVEAAVAKRPRLVRPLLGTALAGRARVRRLRALLSRRIAARRD